MKEEISAAASFLTRLVGKNEQLSAEKVEVFQTSLGSILAAKFQGHWFPEKPCKGQAYRCIRVNGRERRDPVLEQAAAACGLRYEHLRLPAELTVWVDPLEVCCRFGEDEGSYCTVASFKENKENLSDNVIEEIQEKCNNQTPADGQKKSKSRRKQPTEKQKKPSRPFSIPPPKLPLLPSKAPPQWHPHPPSFFDWAPPSRPFRYFQDVPPFPRRPAKRPGGYHFARK